MAIARVAVQVNPAGLSDVPTDQDRIGFKPYVRAITWFLSHEKTKPPLTVSIEGPWGSGKSSFMRQLKKELEAENADKPERYYVEFNAWRSDKDEALWAAFALSFIRQVEQHIPFHKRIVANAALLCRRFEWRHGWLEATRLVFFLLVFVGLTFYALKVPLVENHTSNVVLVILPWLIPLYYAFDKAKQLFGNPLSYDIKKHVRNLRYEERVAFIDRFQGDFADIINSYIGNSGRVFVFIDDLDRCEVPRAAELLQAINLLLSADQANLFFILGLDREMVAAGIAAKNKEILPYLAAGRRNASGKLEIERIGIEYTYYFMEKFIQVPFRVPHPDSREISDWVSDLASDKEAHTTKASQAPTELNIERGGDPKDFEEIANEMARVFRFNPRRLKQFINVYRLRLMIAVATNVLVPAREGGGGAPPIGASMHQLGLFTAMLIRWPSLVGDLIEEPSLISKIYDNPTGKQIDDRWSDLRNAIDRASEEYSIKGLDLRPFLITMPDAYSGTLGEGSGDQPRSTLVSGLGAQPGANTFSDQRTPFGDLEAGVSATTTLTGATGASGASITPPSSAGPSRRRAGPRPK
jgi:hypothetical protein